MDGGVKQLGKMRLESEEIPERRIRGAGMCKGKKLTKEGANPEETC